MLISRKIGKNVEVKFYSDMKRYKRRGRMRDEIKS